MRISRKLFSNLNLNIFVAVFVSLTSCVSKQAADTQARMAFLAGQQQATMRLQQQQVRGPSVTFIGPVQNLNVAWKPGLRLTQAIVSASYTGNGDPSVIVLHRNGEETPIDPKALLRGEDLPLQAGDVIELQP